MKAMIFAAGRGERMRPLTDTCPKPLLKVRGRPLIVWQILNLVRAGITEIVINHAHLGHLFEETLGDGTQFGAQIQYSAEGTALETAGGIAKALPLLVDHPGDAFWLVSGDIYAPGFRFDAAQGRRFAAGDALAHLWLAPNPPYHPAGDFGLAADGHGLADGPGPDGRR